MERFDRNRKAGFGESPARGTRVGKPVRGLGMVWLGVGAMLLPACSEVDSPAPTTRPAVLSPALPPPAAAKLDVGEKIPSEDPVIWDLHSLGLVSGACQIFRSAAPMRDLVKKGSVSPHDPAVLAEAKSRMTHLYALGIRTIVSFENPAPGITPTAAGASGSGPAASPARAAEDDKPQWVALEHAAAAAAGIRWVSYPIANSGPDSLETLSDAQVVPLLEGAVAEIFKDAVDGGVLFHCSAGHDRTGIVTAYIRVKYQHWTVEQAIAEMRRLGHNWPKYSHNGGASSWHEDHLRVIAAGLEPAGGPNP